jgi:amidase
MKNLDQLIEFNEENSKTVLQHFGHEIFLESQQAQDEEKYLQALEIITNRSRNQIDSLLDNKGLDALVGLTRNPAWKTDLKNGDSRGDEEVWATGGLSAVAGYPHITIPLDLVNGFPVGVSFLASAWEEAKLINMAYSFEEQNSFYPRPKDKN